MVYYTQIIELVYIIESMPDVSNEAGPAFEEGQIIQSIRINH